MGMADREALKASTTLWLGAGAVKVVVDSRSRRSVGSALAPVDFHLACCIVRAGRCLEPSAMDRRAPTRAPT